MYNYVKSTNRTTCESLEDRMCFHDTLPMFYLWSAGVRDLFVLNDPEKVSDVMQTLVHPTRVSRVAA